MAEADNRRPLTGTTVGRPGPGWIPTKISFIFQKSCFLPSANYSEMRKLIETIFESNLEPKFLCQFTFSVYQTEFSDEPQKQAGTNGPSTLCIRPINPGMSFNETE